MTDSKETSVKRYVRVEPGRLAYKDVVSHMKNRSLTVADAPVPNEVLAWYVELSAANEQIMEYALVYLRGLAKHFHVTELTEKPADVDFSLSNT